MPMAHKLYAQQDGHTIVIFTFYYMSIGIYGIERHVERLANYLSRAGLNVAIVACGSPGLPSREVANGSVLIIRTPTFGVQIKDSGRRKA